MDLRRNRLGKQEQKCRESSELPNEGFEYLTPHPNSSFPVLCFHSSLSWLSAPSLPCSPALHLCTWALRERKHPQCFLPNTRGKRASDDERDEVKAIPAFSTICLEAEKKEEWGSAWGHFQSNPRGLYLGAALQLSSCQSNISGCSRQVPSRGAGWAQDIPWFWEAGNAVSQARGAHGEGLREEQMGEGKST